ncbi:hypothetical protein L873DRAFT_1687463, partial [Choiromyces venosus 120613-1]
SRSAFTTSSLPDQAAEESGFLPSLSCDSELTSSRCRGIFTTPLCPLWAAQDSAVRPYFASLVFGLAFLRSNSILRIPSCPLLAAQWRGVRPQKSIPSTSNLSPLINNSRSHPFQNTPRTAYDSGVLPSLSCDSGLTTFCSRSLFTTSLCPLSAAQDSAVRAYFASLVFGLTFLRLNSIFMIPSCPLLAAHMRGVRPQQSLPSTSKSFSSDKQFKISSIPKYATQ